MVKDYKEKYMKVKEEYLRLKLLDNMLVESDINFDIQHGGNDNDNENENMGNGYIDVTKIHHLDPNYKSDEIGKKIRTLAGHIYFGAKIGSDIAGTVVTVGNGGDTIPDILFLITDSMNLLYNLGTLLDVSGTAYPYMSRIMNIEWTGYPEDIKKEMESILNEMNRDPDALNIKKEICHQFKNIIDTLAACFGSLVSLFVPSDFGVSRFVIEKGITTMNYTGNTLIEYAGANPFDILVKIFNAIPGKGKKILTDKNELEKFLTELIKLFNGLFPKKKDTLYKSFKKNMTRMVLSSGVTALVVLLPAGILFVVPALTANAIVQLLLSTHLTGEGIDKIVNKLILPNVSTFAEVVMKSIVLTFCAMIILQDCNK